MVNHRGSASPLSIDHDVEPMGEIEKPPEKPETEPTPMVVDVPHEPEPEPETLPTPSPSSCDLDDLPAIFDLPSDVIYASVNELPKKMDLHCLSCQFMVLPPSLMNRIIILLRIHLSYLFRNSVWKGTLYRPVSGSLRIDIIDRLLLNTPTICRKFQEKYKLNPCPLSLPPAQVSQLSSLSNNRIHTRFSSSFFRHHNSSTCSAKPLE